METFVIGIFVVIALTVLAGLAFTAWVAFMIIRGITRAVSPKRPVTAPAMLPPPPTSAPALKYFPPRAPEPRWSRCPQDRCRTPNPPDAQFCRRCGMNLVAAKVSGSSMNGRVLARA
jgi:hypothetical protein